MDHTQKLLLANLGGIALAVLVFLFRIVPASKKKPNFNKTTSSKEKRLDLIFAEQIQKNKNRCYFAVIVLICFYFLNWVILGQRPHWLDSAFFIVMVYVFISYVSGPHIFLLLKKLFNKVIQ